MVLCEFEDGGVEVVGVVVTHEEDDVGVGGFSEDFLEFFVGVFVVVKYHDGVGGGDGKSAMVEICYFYHDGWGWLLIFI